MAEKVEELTENGVNLDKTLTEEVGQFGKYQIRVLALCALVAATQGLARNEYVFTFVKVQTRCLIPECENTSSPQFNFTPSWILDALPTSENSFDNCYRYGNSSTNTKLKAASAIATEFCSADLFDRNTSVPCEEYVYEDKNSAMYDFGMACDVWRPNLLGSIDFLGMMISLPLTGFVADRWGRRVAIVLSGVNYAFFGCLKYFSNSYTSYLSLSFIQAMIGASANTWAYIVAIEYVGPKYRMVAGPTVSCFVSVGTTLKGLLAWTQPSWRNLVLICNIPLFVTVIFYPFLAPESFRWLMSKGRYEKAKQIIKKAAKINGNALSEKTLQMFSSKKEKKIESDVAEPWLVCLVFKHKRVLFRCLLTPMWWITALFIYFGMELSSVGISGNKYANYTAVAAAAIPGYWISSLLLNRIGRKPLLTGGYWICGACQIAYVLMPKGHYWLSLTMYLVGKIAISAVMATVYVYTAELYPTRYRSTLLAYSSMIGRLGAILGPLAPALSDGIWQPLPFVLFAGMALLSGALVTLAPETRGCPLPDTMQEAEDLGRHQETRIMRLLKKLLFRRKCYTIR